MPTTSETETKVSGSGKAVPPPNPNVITLGEGHEIHRVPNGRDTERVVRRIQKAGVGEIELLPGKRLVYAVVTNQNPPDFSAEITAAINGAGHDTRVVVVPLHIEHSFVLDRLTQYAGTKLGTSVTVVSPSEITPRRFNARVRKLGAQEAPEMKLPSTVDSGFLAKTKS